MKKILKKLSQKIYHHLIEAQSENEEQKRKEFILNILLISSEILMATILLLSFIREVIDIISGEDRGFQPAVFILMGAVFVFAHYLSRKQKIKIASLLFLSIFFIPNLYLSFHWGIDLPQSLLLYAFTILSAGILISTRFSLITTLFISLYLATLGYLQGHQIITPNTYWATEMVTIYDAIPIIITLSIMATLSWLANREIENSLRKALNSEQALKIERDNLEITVKKRTEQLQKMQMEKISQLYRFAEFGRISAGIFHDLINPLTAVSLNLEQLSRDKQYQKTSYQVEQAVEAAKRMEVLVISVKKQLQKEECRRQFSINQEVKGMISLLNHRAIREKVLLKFRYEEDIKIFGDPLKFSQIIMNLITNALDALGENSSLNKKISIKLNYQNNQEIKLTIKDNGPGISSENFEKIFTPFFSTKQGKGLGLGLSSIQHLVEQDFRGKIEAKNNKEGGCLFSIILPIDFKHEI
jgi:signal transduction histidine kinase